MKTIAIFQTDMMIGGVQKSLINLLNNIDSKKYAVDLYLFKKGDFFREIPSFVNVIMLPKPSFVYRVFSFNFLNKVLKSSIKKEYDFVIDYNGEDTKCSLLALNTNGKKKICWIHNDFKLKSVNEFKFKFNYNLNKTKYAFYDKTVFVSKGALDAFKEINVVNNERVIPNFIDTNRIIDDTTVTIDFKPSRDVYNLVCVGKLCYQKGYDKILPVIRKLLNERRDFHLYFIGDGEEKTNLETQVSELGIDSYVTFLGAKKNPYPYMNKMDALLFSSRYEGQGVVLLEAKCLGLEIIMPKYLEKYCDGVKGSDNVLDKLVEVKKVKKNYDYLEDYNLDIKNKIKELLK